MTERAPTQDDFRELSRAINAAQVEMGKIVTRLDVLVDVQSQHSTRIDALERWRAEQIGVALGRGQVFGAVRTAGPVVHAIWAAIVAFAAWVASGGKFPH